MSALEKTLNDNKINWDYRKHTINDVLSKISNSEWNLRPEYQRYFIWDDKKQSEFIDTLVRGWPIPPILINYKQDDEGNEVSEILDGQQRLQTIKRFFDGESCYTPSISKLKIGDIPFAKHSNSYLKVESNSNDRLLNPLLKKALRGANIPVMELRFSQNNILLVREMFGRINSNSMSLTKQELYNAIYANSAFKRVIYSETEKLQNDEYWGSTGRVFEKAKRDRMGNQARLGTIFIVLIKNRIYDKDDEVEATYQK